MELPNHIRQISAEASHGLGRAGKDLKESAGPRQIQHDLRVRTQRGQLQIAIAASGLLHAIEQHVHSGGVDFAHERKIKDKLRTVMLQQRPYFLQKDASLLHGSGFPGRA